MLGIYAGAKGDRRTVQELAKLMRREGLLGRGSSWNKSREVGNSKEHAGNSEGQSIKAREEGTGEGDAGESWGKL